MKKAITTIIALFFSATLLLGLTACEKKAPTLSEAVNNTIKELSKPNANWNYVEVWGQFQQHTGTIIVSENKSKRYSGDSSTVHYASIDDGVVSWYMGSHEEGWFNDMSDHYPDTDKTMGEYMVVELYYLINLRDFPITPLNYFNNVFNCEWGLTQMTITINDKRLITSIEIAISFTTCTFTYGGQSIDLPTMT